MNHAYESTYMNFMVTTNQKLTIDTQKIRRGCSLVAQQVKDLGLSLLWHRFYLWPLLKFHLRWAWQKKLARTSKRELPGGSCYRFFRSWVEGRHLHFDSDAGLVPWSWSVISKWFSKTLVLGDVISTPRIKIHLSNKPERLRFFSQHFINQPRTKVLGYTQVPNS